jgi:hypothetical protein
MEPIDNESKEQSTEIIELKNQFINSYMKLRFDYKISCDDLDDMLKNKVKKKSEDLPKRRIIYNTSYGGFSYSKLFHKYSGDIKLDIEYEDDREYSAHLMCPFGKLILDTHPEIKRAVYMEYTSDIAKINYDTYRIVSMEYCLEQFKNNITKFRNYYTTHTEDKWHYGIQELKIRDILPEDHTNICLSLPCMYTFDSIKNVLDISIAEEVKALDKIAKYKSKIDKIIPRIKYIDDIPEFFETFKKIMKLFFDPEERNLIESRNKIHFASEFEVDAKSIKTWKSYRGCGAVGIMYYMLYNKSHVEYDKQILNTIHETFGLHCASGQYASLAITEIPALCSYKTEEYDGSEKIIPL